MLFLLLLRAANVLFIVTHSGIKYCNNINCYTKWMLCTSASVCAAKAFSCLQFCDARGTAGANVVDSELGAKEMTVRSSDCCKKFIVPASNSQHTSHTHTHTLIRTMATTWMRRIRKLCLTQKKSFVFVANVCEGELWTNGMEIGNTNTTTWYAWNFASQMKVLYMRIDEENARQCSHRVLWKMEWCKISTQKIETTMVNGEWRRHRYRWQKKRVLCGCIRKKQADRQAGRQEKYCEKNKMKRNSNWLAWKYVRIV